MGEKVGSRLWSAIEPERFFLSGSFNLAFDMIQQLSLDGVREKKLKAEIFRQLQHTK